MYESKEFQLWLRRTLGQQLALDAELSRFDVPAHDLKIEVRIGGRWTEVRMEDLRD